MTEKNKEIEIEDKANFEINLAELERLNDLRPIEIKKQEQLLKVYDFEKEKISELKEIKPNQIAQILLQKNFYATFEDTKEIYQWNKNTGLYEPCETNLEKTIQYLCEPRATTALIEETIKIIKRKTYFMRQQLEENINDIPIKNGVFDLETEKINPYTPEKIFFKKHNITGYENEDLFFTKHSDNGEQVTINNPIDEFLEEVVATQEDMVLLKELVGYCFYRKIVFQNFFILIGEGANGKSVFLNLLGGMLGEENVSHRAIQSLTDENFSLVSLYQMNANIVNDLPRRAIMESGMVKQLVAGDPIEANQKFKQSLKFKNYAKLIFSCNDIPETNDTSNGFFRRAIIINFPNSFYGREIRNLDSLLLKNEKAVFQFFKSCVGAFKQAMMDNRLIREESVFEKREQYLLYSNSAHIFCEKFLEFSPEERIPSNDLYERYKLFCKEKNVRPKSEGHFFVSLHKFFSHKTRKVRAIKYEFGVEIRYSVIEGVGWKDG